MEQAIDSARLDRLMAEMAWVRRLARALVGDTAAADDVAQDAWLLALQHPPDEARPLRPWLGRVVQNVVRMRYRAARRREAREAHAESGEPPTPAELIERVELQRAVADEVLGLTEPYRSTILMYFVDGRSSAEIARQLGVPDGTVRRRLKTALDQLRERMDRRGDAPRRGWLAALVPLARGGDSAAAAATTLGVLAMKKLIATVVILVVLLLLGAAVWWRYRESPAEPATSAVLADGARATPLAPGSRSATLGLIPGWLAQRDAASRRVAGIVRSADGPVHGAIVRLAFTPGPGAVEPLAERRTAADGAFDFGIQPAAQFTVSAQAAGYAAVASPINVADPRASADKLELMLRACRSRLSGVVRDASGGGVAKARVWNAGASGAETDATGQFLLCLPDHNSLVRVEADGYGTITVPLRLFGEMQRDFVLVPEAILTGRVVTTGDAPVAGARVVAEPDASERERTVTAGWATTDPEGRFQIAGLTPGRFAMRATADGLAMPGPQLAIARSASTSELRLVVEPVAEIRGQVMASGAPVSGARVAATRHGLQVSPAAISQGDGSFVLSAVLSGTVELVAPPYRVQSPRSLAIDKPRIDGVVLEVQALATLRGRVTRHGKPVAGAQLSVSRPQMFTTSDASGSYVFEGLASGDHRVHAASYDLRAVGEDRTITIAAGDTATLDLELEHAGQVTGTVVDHRGAPVPNAYVRLVRVGNAEARGGESMTNRDGQFDIGAVSEGDYLAEVYPMPLPARAFAAAPGDLRDPIRVARDATTSGIRLAIQHELFAIRGTVVDDSGPVSDVQVRAIGGRDYGTMAPPSAMTDVAGRFEITGLAGGSYQLRAHAADGSEADLRDVAAGAPPVTLTLARGGTIEGTLAGFTATPTVELFSATGDRTTRARVGVTGTRFKAPGLSPGRYLVQAQSGSQIDSQSVDVRAAETVQVALQGRGLATITGRIVEHDERGTRSPLAGMQCGASLSVAGRTTTPLAGSDMRSTSDAGGRFTLSVPQGRVRILCSSPSAALSPAGIDVDVGTGRDTPTVELVAVRGNPGATRRSFGFGIAALTLPLTVDRIEPGSPAATSGLATGDRLISIDGASLQGMLPMGALFLLGNHKPGAPIALVIERGGKTQTIQIATAGSPAR